MTSTVFDLEANGFLYEADRIWCIATELTLSGPDHILDALTELDTYDVLIGHNILNYDIPLIQKLYPWFKPKEVHDTFILSCLFWPDIPGGHSLEAWAKRLKLPVQKQAHEDWSQYTPEMGTRCQSDVVINRAVWDYMQKELNAHDWSKAIKIEYAMALDHAQQVLNGVQFDRPAARLLYERIEDEVEAIENEVNPQLPLQCKQHGVTIKEPFKIDGTLKKAVVDWFE